MKRAAYGVWTDAEGKKTEADYLQCCHCQWTWPIVKGSGRQRGWCTLCAAPTCGRVACQSCQPFERRLEAEARRDALMRAIG